MNYGMVGWGPLRAFAVEPSAGAYGHLASDVVMGFHIARSLGKPLYLVRSPAPANHAFYDLKSPQVAVLEEGSWRGRWTRRAWSRRIPPPGLRVGAEFGINFRRAYATNPVPVGFPPDLERRTAEKAARLGLTPDRPFVVLHVREAGYKAQESDQDRARSARIEDTFPSIDSLVGRGYRVVRIGDPGARPIRRDGLVDLATSPDRTDWLELWCLLHCAFFIAPDAGTFVAGSWLAQRPCLAINVVTLTSAFPVKTSDRYIVKHARDRRTGRLLSLGEVATADHLLNRTDPQRFEILDNTPEEILEAVEEMHRDLQAPTPETPSQQSYREGLQQALKDERVVEKFSRKASPELYYLGDGRIADSFARRTREGGPDPRPAISSQRSSC